MAISAEAQNQIIALTVGMFDASPGAKFLTELADVYEQQGGIDAVASFLGASTAFNNQYAGLVTDEGRIDKALDLLGLEADTDARAEAKEFFEQRVEDGDSQVAILQDAIEFLQQDAVPDTFADVKAKFDNKVEVATVHSVENQASSDNVANLKDVVAGVTADPATVDSANENVKNQDSAQTFTLTTDADNASADQFEAPLQTLSGVEGATTLNTSDSLTGTGENPTLNAVITAAQGPLAPTLDGVETVNLTSNANTTVALRNAEGVESITSQDSRGYGAYSCPRHSWTWYDVHVYRREHQWR